MNINDISGSVLDVLDTLPDEEKKKAIAAILQKSEWEESIDYEDDDKVPEDIPYFDGSGEWKNYKKYFLFRVTNGILKLGLKEVTPNGNSQWIDNRTIVVDDYFQSELFSLQKKVYDESTEEMKIYGKWVEDNGEDPLRQYQYWFNNAFLYGREKPDMADKSQVSLQAWMVNKSIRPYKFTKEDLEAKIRECFPNMAI